MANTEIDPEKPKIWFATTSTVDEKEFEETRRCLLKSYNSYSQTHSGYIIALIVGLSAFVATIISSLTTLLESLGGTITFGVLLIGIVVIILLIGVMMLRIVYWSIWVSVTITISNNKAFEYFNTRKVPIPINKAYDYFDTMTPENKDYFNKAANMAMLQIAIDRQIREDENTFPWFKKLALKTAGKGFWF